MKIIKQGDQSKIFKEKQFECENCGCLFECESHEYHVEHGWDDHIYISADCPTCKHHIILG